MTDSDSMVRWIQHRDAGAFRDIAVRYSDMVFATCRRVLGNTAEAEDVAQECFEALAAAKRPPHTLGAWLHGVAEEIAWDDLQTFVDEAIAELPGKLRRPIVAHYLEGQPQNAVARAEGVAPATVHHRIGVAIERIRESLRKRGGPLAEPGRFSPAKRIVGSGGSAPIGRRRGDGHCGGRYTAGRFGRDIARRRPTLRCGGGPRRYAGRRCPGRHSGEL